MKRLNLLLVAITILALVAACTAPPPAAPQAPAPAPTEAPAAQPEPTKAPEAAAAVHPALKDNKITIAWIPKALNNPVFEIGRVGAENEGRRTDQSRPYTRSRSSTPPRSSPTSAEQAAGHGRCHRQGRGRHRRLLQRPDRLRRPHQEGPGGRHRGHDLGLRLARQRPLHLPRRGQLRGRQGRG